MLSVVVMVWYAVLRRELGAGALGGELFAVTSFLAGCLALISGPLLTADVVASERREGTLGLLFLTDLRGWEVALGKLAASSVGAVFYLASMVPMLAVSMLLGGVSAGEYLRMVAWLASALGCSLALGLLASTMTTSARRAGGLAVLLLLLAGGGVPLLGGIWYWWMDRNGAGGSEAAAIFDKVAGWASVVPAYFHAFDSGYARSAMYYQRGMAFTVGLGVASMAWASWRLARLAKDEGARGDEGRVGGWRGWLGGNGDAMEARREARRRRRARLLELGPMQWLAGRRGWRDGWVWGVMALAVGVDGIVVWVEGLSPELVIWLWVITSMVLHVVLKAWMATEAPRQFHEDRRSGAMELLVTTPLRAEEMVTGRLRALARLFGGPVGVMLLADVGFVVWGLGGGPGTAGLAGAPVGELVAFWGARMAFLATDGLAFVWMGMWLGARTTGRRTTLPLLGLVMGVPWACLMLYLLVLVAGADAMFRSLGPVGNIVFAMVGGSANSLVWAWVGWSGLRGPFLREWLVLRPGEGRARVR